MSVVEEYNAEYDPAWVGAAIVEERKEEFESKDDPLSDDSDKIKDALAALLTLGAVVAYCSGAAGAAVGAAMSIGAGIVTTLKEPPKSDSDVTKIVHSMEAMQRNEKVNKQLVAIEAYWSWLKINNQKGALKREETVESPHPWICDARTVQWAYKLRTEDGTLELSDWSDEYTLPTDLSPEKPAKLPVLKLEDFGFPTSTQRVVFHRKTTKSNKQEGFGPQPIQARVIEGATFADVMPEL